MRSIFQLDGFRIFFRISVAYSLGLNGAGGAKRLGRRAIFNAKRIVFRMISNNDFYVHNSFRVTGDIFKTFSCRFGSFYAYLRLDL